MAKFTRTPWILSLLAVLAAGYLLFPLIALAIRVPWGSFTTALGNPETTQLLEITLSAAVLSTLLTIMLGVPLAVWMSTRSALFARILVLLPLAMPPVVSGLALSAALGNRGLAAPLLDALGIQFAFAFPGVVAAHIFVCLPLVVVSVDSALRQIDQEVLLSAASIGMSPWRILTRITLPTIAPALVTGTGLAFARSLGEFGTTITFAGSMPGITRTMSLAVYLEREIDRDNAYVLAAILIVLAILTLLVTFIPTMLTKTPTPRAVAIDDMDVARLRDLTRPDDAPSITIDSITIPGGVITAVIGPNGSGKTTLMSRLAGRIPGAHVPSDVMMLTQAPGLPKITTVLGAITMATRDETRSRMLIDAAGLHPLTHTPIAELSGGQAAHVSLVRALACRPGILILDEPLAAIDVSSAARWRELLRATAGDRTTIIVTHDEVDIAGLSSHLLVLDRGKVVAEGPTSSLLALPPNDFVAQLTGVNLIDGIVTAIDGDMVTLHADGCVVTGMRAHGASISQGQRATATFEPTSVTLTLNRTGNPNLISARNHWSGKIARLERHRASEIEATVALGSCHIRVPITTQSALDLKLAAEMNVLCEIKALSITIHPR